VVGQCNSADEIAVSMHWRTETHAPECNAVLSGKESAQGVDSPHKRDDPGEFSLAGIARNGCFPDLAGPQLTSLKQLMQKPDHHDAVAKKFQLTRRPGS
jgi:hypothetical protein